MNIVLIKIIFTNYDFRLKIKTMIVDYNFKTVVGDDKGCLSGGMSSIINIVYTL